MSLRKEVVAMRVSRVLAVGVALAAVIAMGCLTRSATATFKGGNGLIAYSHGNGDEVPLSLLTIRPDGTHNRRLLGPDEKFKGGAGTPKWSSDGRKLLFTRLPYLLDQVDENGILPRSLWYSTASGTRLRPIPLGLGGVRLYGYDWAPDGRHIVFAAANPKTTEGPQPKIYTIAIDGTHRRTLTSGYWPSWSGDGRHIVFERVGYIFVMRPDGTRRRDLTKASGLGDSHPSFSPDGRQVAFVRYRFTPGGSLVQEWRTIHVSGHADTLVIARQERQEYPPADFSYCAPQWTPDGQRLAAGRAHFDSLRGSQLTTLSPSGNNERVAFTFPGSVYFYIWDRVGACELSWQPRH